MPNHVKNVVKIKGIKTEKEKDYLLRKLAMKDKHGEWFIDFDLIIPEPRFKNDCPKDCIVNKASHITAVEDRPWFNWYNWHCTYWGTKWGAYDGYVEIGKTQLTFVFNTAWSAPYPIYGKLTKLGYNLDIRYADEQIGANCGKIIYNAKNKSWTELLESELENPKRFANNLWEKY